MNAVMRILRSTKQEKVAWIGKQLPIILATVAFITLDDFIIGQNVSARWLPILGLTLGVSLACIGFCEIAFIRKRCTACGKRIFISEGQEKIVLISGRSLFLLGVVLVLLNNSIALVFNIHWLHTLGHVLGLSLACIGIWLLALHCERYKGDRQWQRTGFIFSSLLFVEVLFKFGFGW